MAEVKYEKLRILEERINKLSSNEIFNRAGERIGTRLTAKIVENAIKENIKATGSLIGNIGYKVYSISGGTEIQVGVFGIPYARFHEYGTQNEKNTNPGIILLKILDSYLKIGHFGRESKGVFDRETGRLRARPFVRPAVDDNHALIIQIFREEIANASR